MNLPSPAIAIGWEIWARNRAGMLTVFTMMVSGTLLIRGLRSWAPGADFAGPVAYTLTALALLVTLAGFHFTEGTKRGGFGGFPVRLFNLPIRTRTLVALPMIYGASALVLVFLCCALLLLKPTGADTPILWPCVYLVFGLTQFQMILWSLAESRYLKLLCLSIAASILTFGWMFFVPSIIAGALNDLGYDGSPEMFMDRLLIGLALSGPMAYLISVWRVRIHRHGVRTRSSVLSALWESTVIRFGSRLAPFSSADQALFWHEWRRTGLILPGVVGVIFVLTCVPTWLSGGLTGRGTTGILMWLLFAPLLFAAVIGRGFGKPDFWRATLKIAPYHAVKPVTAGQWVAVKLKVALGSVALTWAVAIYLTFIWTAFCGDFLAFEKPLRWFRFFYTPVELWLLMLLGFPVIVIVTWRFLVVSLAGGLSGSKAWYYVLNGVLAIGVTTLVVWMIKNGDRDDSPVALHRLWPAIQWLPTTLTFAVIAKAALAAWAWDDVLRRGMISSRWVWKYIAGWLCASGILAALFFILCRNTLWLRHLLMLGSLLAVPLAGPALAMRSFATNRSFP